MEPVCDEDELPPLPRELVEAVDELFEELDDLNLLEAAAVRELLWHVRERVGRLEHFCLEEAGMFGRTAEDAQLGGARVGFGSGAFTFRVDERLKNEFARAAKARDRTGAQLLRDFMRDFVPRQEEAAEHDVWFRRQVQAGQEAADAGDLGLVAISQARHPDGHGGHSGRDPGRPETVLGFPVGLFPIWVATHVFVP